MVKNVVQGPLIRRSLDGRGAMAEAYHRGLRVRVLNALEQAVRKDRKELPRRRDPPSHRPLVVVGIHTA
jgi:hypothetical protein